jgi:hypothetical protein
MHKPILFLGGMCGDIIILMVDPTCAVHSATIEHTFDNLKKPRQFMKKYWRYTNAQKDRYYSYYNKVNSLTYSLTHDTDYAKTIPETIQLHCSDIDRLEWFSTRYRKIYEDRNNGTVLKDLCKSMNFTVDGFNLQYANMIKDWQAFHIFDNRFDISLIGKDEFLDQAIEYFQIKEKDRAQKIYCEWQKKNYNK